MVVGDVGKTIRLLTSTVLTGNNVAIVFCKPDGIQGEWSATISTEDPSVIEYVTIADDIDTAGTWYLRSKIFTAGGKTIFGESVKVDVQNICS